MKMRNLSLIASSVILGSALFVGCGSSSSSSSSSVPTTTGPVVNSYLVHLNSPAQDANEQNSTTVVFDGNKTTGKVRFLGAVSGTVTVPKDAIIDSNANYIYDENDSTIGFVLRGDASGAITPLTTFAIDNNVTLPDSLKVDPIAKMEDGDPTAYLAEQAIIKAMKVKRDGNTSFLGKIISFDNNGTMNVDDTNVSADVQNALKIASPANIALVKAAIDNNMSTKDIVISSEKGNLTSTIITDIFDNNTTKAVSEANKISKVNATDINKLKISEANVSATIDAYPSRLYPGSITIGGKTAILDGNSFNVTVDSTDSNITDFFDISFGASVEKSFTTISGVGVTIAIKDEKTQGNSVTMTINNAEISSKGASSLKVTLPSNSQIEVAQTGLPALKSIIGDRATASTNKELVMNDLSFNVNTILGALDNSNISDAINALNTYFKQPRTYDVTISFKYDANATYNENNTTDLVSDYTTFNGTVTVKNTTANTTSSDGVCSEDPFGNPIPTDPDCN